MKKRVRKMRKQTSHKVVIWGMWFVSIAFLLLLWAGIAFAFVSEGLMTLVGTIGVATIGAYMANSGFEKKVNAQYGVISTTATDGTVTQTSTCATTNSANSGGSTI
jgi:hypothetical protein